MNFLTSCLLGHLLIVILALPVALFAEDQKALAGQFPTFDKLKIKLPEIILNNTTLEEAIEFLRLRSIELDSAKENPGLNFVIHQTPGDPQIAGNIIAELDARNLSIIEILDLVCLKTKTQFQVEEFAVVILPVLPEQSQPNAPKLTLTERKWTTPPNFLDYLTPPAGKLNRPEITTLLRALGVTLPPNATASFYRPINTLVVRSTPIDLHLIDTIVKSSRDPEGTLAERQAINQIILPSFSLNNSTLGEAVEFIRLRSRELDPAKKGLNINFLGDEKLSERIISSLNLRNVPLTTALHYICTQSQTRLHIQGRNVSILPQ